MIEDIQKTSIKELRKTKILTRSAIFQSSFLIYGFKTVIWNPVAERAIVLDDPIITEMFKQIFEKIWGGIKIVI